MIGSRSSESCKAVMAEFGSLRTGEPAAALASFGLSYRSPDGPVSTWVRETDKALARIDGEGAPIDDLAIVAALDAAAASSEQAVAERARIDVVQVLNRVSLIDMRRKFEHITKADPNAELGPLLAEWDDAWCLWDGALRMLAQASDEETGEGWEATIVEAFMSGRSGLIRRFDVGLVSTQREIAEKGSYLTIHRLILKRAATARELDDVRIARVARGLLGIIEDRIADRNGPGLARIEEMLRGEPTAIDADVIERELDKAFAKRARKYCDEAVVAGHLGSPEGIKGSWEGLVYAKLILPGMRRSLAGQGFDADEYVADWTAYVEAVAEADADEAAAISGRLVQWNCAYQEVLGIAECTSVGNETQ